ncbi:MAG: acetyl-CoA acetyltransferase [Actinomycetia bacterium]|jgi:acetyl-CoA acetyltransferase|nr:acetyl-CoA acetyltransferase [Actinomycetes bacterium]
MAVDANDIIERRACITGAGQSEIGRRLGRDPFELTLDACLAAIADAGLTTADIDGISTYPGPMDTPPGFSGAGAYDVMDALRLECGWYGSGIETSGQLGSVINACLAVGAGLANHVVCFRSVWEGSAQGDKGRAGVMPGGGGGGGGKSFRAGSFMQWTLPFSAPSAAIWIAMYAQAHFHKYGTTREQLAWIALNARRNAELNPNAIYRSPMSMDDYLNARMISTPFCLYDCDVPCDGATAVIVSRVERARDLRKQPLRVEAVGTAIHGRPSWDQFDDLTTMPMRDAGAQLWTRTDLKPSDVQLLEAYDGFSFITMDWIEALQFCGPGESGPFIDGGERIARDGQLPLNTHGGQLSGGRLHGYGFIHEAAIQMWGEGGERQVPRTPEVAAVAAGGGNTCGCLLLVNDG